jgi:transposase-like protein
VRKNLDAAIPVHVSLSPQPTVLLADTTFWSEGYGVCVFRSASLKRNLCWTEVKAETAAVYAQSLQGLLERGWVVQAAVIDGRRGVARVFEHHGIPVQFCQFHQMKTVTKYLTRKPKTEAAQALRALSLTLHKTTEADFTAALNAWHVKYASVLNERSPAPHTKRGWEYTHYRLKSAYRSLTTNLKYLFTYQKYPELHIPNTTNSLDGSFSQLKKKINAHGGLRRDRRFKMISALLATSSKRPTQKDH